MLFDIAEHDPGSCGLSIVSESAVITAEAGQPVPRVPDLDAAIAHAKAPLGFVGAGHSVGIHTATPAHARRLAEELDVVRVLVNQAHTFGNGGGFDNGLPFTLSMGCGSWQGNSISENLNWRHFINITHLVTTIPEDKPGEEDLFGAYWSKYGK